MKYIVINDKSMVVLLPEQIDHHHIHSLCQAIDKIMLEREPDELIFDFSETKFMDSSGIGLLMGRYRKMEYMEGKVFLHNTNARLEKILQMSGITKIIGKYEE